MTNVTVHTSDDEKKITSKLSIPPDTIKRTLSGRTLLNYEMKKFDRETVWESCCLRTDARMCRYITKSIFAFSILAFCATGLLTTRDPCSPLLTFYSSTISLIAGSYLEQQSSSSSSNRDDNKK